MLTFIKSIHTAIFLFMSACILYIVYAGLTGSYHPTLLTFTMAAVVLEVVVYAANRFRCPLTALARQYGDASGNDWIADLFLPKWASDKIAPVCGVLWAVGVVALVFRLLQG